MRTRDDVIDFLVDCRREAGEPMIGAREVEIVASLRKDGIPTRAAWRMLSQLRAAGTIFRRNGWCWITEEAFAEYPRAGVT